MNRKSTRDLFLRVSCLVLLTSSQIGCTSTVKLRHQATGQTATCGPYVHTIDAVLRERGCIADFQRQGYERIQD